MARVSIVVPCFNEEAGLANLRQRLDEAMPILERDGDQVDVLLFDDGSRDRTLAVMHEVFDDDARFRIHHGVTNKNVGGVLRDALPLVSGEIVVTMDSDCTYHPREIRALLDRIHQGWDVATGSPYHPQGKVENVKPGRLLLSRGLSVLYRGVTPIKLWTYTSMFRAYRREVLERIRWESNGFLACSEILIEAAASGATIAEYPTTLSVRRFGQSKIRIARVIRDHLRYLLRIVTDGRLRRRLRKNFKSEATRF